MAEQTTSSITIAASKEDIVAVIADFESYPEWVEAVREARVLERGADGRPARVRFSLDAGVLKDDYILRYEWDDDHAVHWDLVEEGAILSDMQGSYLLAEREGHTDVTYELAVDIKIPMIGMFKRKAEKVIIDTALGELKRRVES